MSVATDPEKANTRKEFHVGFTDFAEFIASDRELSLYKGFASLAARNLLYLQAELQVLETELAALDDEDQSTSKHSQDEEEKKSIDGAARAWERIVSQCEAGDERGVKRKKLIMDIRKLMKEYGASLVPISETELTTTEKALLRRSQVLSLETPDSSTQEAFTNWFRHTKPLRGRGFYLLDDEQDLIALKTKESPDRLTSIVQHLFGYYLQEKRDTQPESWGPMYYFKETVISRIVGVIAVLVAAGFLIGAIVSLYFVGRMGPRLGIVAAFTVGFAAVVGLLTNAKRVEIFAATAA